MAFVRAIHPRTLDVRRWWRGFNSRATRGDEFASEFVEASISTWVDEGHLAAEDAARLRARLTTPELALVLRNLGVHLAISIPLRFPLGSIARFSWTTGSRIRAEWRALRGRESARLARQVHSIPVILATLVPGFGSGAYLLATPLRKNRALAVILFDRLIRRLPAHLYERLHLAALTTCWAHPRPATIPWSRQRMFEAARRRAALIRGHRWPIAAVLSFNISVLATATVLWAVFDYDFPFSEDLGLVNTIDALQLLAGGCLGVLAFRLFWRRQEAPDPAEAAGIFLWAMTGIGLIAFAFDDFFGLHERVGGWISDHIGVLPLLTNDVDDVITLGYGVVCIAVLALFRHELAARRASSAVLVAAIVPATLMLVTDAYGHGPLAWLERPSQTTAVGLLFMAHVLRYREVRAG